MRVPQSHLWRGDSRYVEIQRAARTEAETDARQPSEADRARGRDRRRLEDVLERRALARELDGE